MSLNIARGRDLLISDDFSKLGGGVGDSSLVRTDSGQGWVFGEQQFLNKAAGAAAVLTNATVNSTWANAGQADAVVSMPVQFQGDEAILLRASGTSDYIMCRAQGTSFAIATRTSGGGFTTLASTAHSIAAGTYMLLEARIVGTSITFTVNGGAFTLTATSSLNSTSQMFGMYGSKTSALYYSFTATKP